MKATRATRLSLISLLLLMLILIAASATQALVIFYPQNDGWSAIEPMFDLGVHDEMAVAVDATQHVHALWIQHDALLYSRWNGREWTIPMDVIARPSADKLSWPTLAAGPRGDVYACWLEQAMLYCSYALEGDAVDPRNWSVASAVSHAQAMHSDLEMDSMGNLHLVYAVRDNDVYYRYSSNRGMTWSSPIDVAFRPLGVLTDYPRLSVDASGGVHVTWTDYAAPEGVPVLGTFYTRSLDGGETWKPALEVTSGHNYAEINVLAVNENQIHLAWNGRIGFGGRYHRWSDDRGETWYPVSEVVPPSAEGGGKTGPPDMAVDAAGNVHFASGMNPGGIMYSNWTKGIWRAPEFIPSPSGWAEKARIVVSEGNHVHVFWQEWHTSRIVDAPHEKVVPFPTATVTTLALTETSPETPEPVSELDRSSSGPVPDEKTNTEAKVSVLLVSILPALLIVVFAFLYKQIHQK